MLAKSWACRRAASRFHDYAPQSVTFKKADTWFRQFDKRHWKSLSVLLSKIVYFSRNDTERALVTLNEKLLDRLLTVGIGPEKLIYMQIDAAGSSSPAMLSTLRDAARLERRGCHLLDSNDLPRIFDVTNQLEQGAIVYVDDFIGTGKQFSRSRKRVSDYVVGNFSEFLITPCICEEAVDRIQSVGVEPITQLIHLKRDRPLHSESEILDEFSKTALIDLCRAIHPQEGLGFKRLATMVVFSRNTPNTVPLILRGSLYQQPFFGILPRTTDLPIG